MQRFHLEAIGRCQILKKGECCARAAIRMSIVQTVEIPADRRLIVYVPDEVPAGKALLTFTPISTTPNSNERENAEKIWAYNRSHPQEIRAKIQKLQGSLGENAFGGMDGVAYQQKIRDEWDA